MTYLYITPFFPSPERWRGAYGYDFVRALSNLGRYSVRVFVPGYGPDYMYKGIRVHRFLTLNLPSGICPFLFRKFNEMMFIRAVKRAKIDISNVVVCHGNTAFLSIYPLVVKRNNSNCLTILHHHDLQSYGLNIGILRHFWLYNMLQFVLLRKLHEEIDVHVFISEAVKQSFLKAPDTSWTSYDDYRKQMRFLPYRSVKIKKGVVLHNGVNTELFNIKQRPQITHDKFTIGCIGNFVPLKGHMALLKAMVLLRKEGIAARCLMVGSGECLLECKRFAERNKLDVSFLEEMHHDKLPEFFGKLDVFCLPSKFEGFGCVYTESWACGVPFIACKGQGIEDVLPMDERKKWLCVPGDEKDLADKIEGFYKNKYEQHLSGEIAIDKLVSKFLQSLDI